MKVLLDLFISTDAKLATADDDEAAVVEKRIVRLDQAEDSTKAIKERLRMSSMMPAGPVFLFFRHLQSCCASL